MRALNRKEYVLLISAVMAIALLALFLVLPITPLVIVAYVFAMFGIILFCFGMFQVLSNPDAYPWFAAFPKTIIRYMFLQMSISTVFVLIEVVSDWAIPMRWFLLIQILLLAFFTIILLMLHASKAVISDRGAEIKGKVVTLRFMQADTETLIQMYPSHSASLRKVADAIRYSDPMSHPSLALYEEQIHRTILEMQNGQDIESKCNDLLIRIADRNRKVMALK